jgi:hypothetical protein
MDPIRVHSRINERHPELRSCDVETAWRNAFQTARREGAEKELYVAVGFDINQRLLEMVAIKDGNGTLIFHAKTPPTKKTMAELKLIGR